MVPALPPNYDVLIIGAGLAGMYSLIKMRELGLRALVIEAGNDVGGAWYWNRYPGACFDSESVSYGFSFSKELLEEWKWEEAYSPQPKTEKYCRFVCEKFDLRKDIKFGFRVKSARFMPGRRIWALFNEKGESFTSRFLITALGPLTSPTLPNVPGLKDFKGQSFHTSRWPEGLELTGKKVAVMGTGSTGIQVIQTIAQKVGHLSVIQRQPNWAKPLHNTKISDEKMAQIRLHYPKIFQRCMETSNAFIHGEIDDPRRTVEVPKEEREAFWEKRYSEPGFGLVFSNYKDVHTDKEANDLLSEFIANKIRSRVHDPVLAEKLIPRNHGVATKRLPLESNYFEVFNQPNVELVDLRDAPLECVTEKGIRTTEKEYEFDVIIYATGFHTITGAFDDIDFTGVGGVKLRDMWKDSPRTYLGMTVPGFPNMFMIMGPHQAMGNVPRSIEYAVNWVSQLLQTCVSKSFTWVEPTDEQADKWFDHVQECAKGMLANEVDSWMTGVNTNVAGRQKRIVMRYSGGIIVFREHCEKVAANRYRGMRLL